MSDHNAANSTLMYADDLDVGDLFDLGTHQVSLEEIVDFAEQWDPQGFHVDPAIAEAGAFGGIIASGVHSIAILQRLSVATVYRRWAVIAGRALHDVQLTSPVRPGMDLRGEMRIDAIQHRGPGRSLIDHTSRLLYDDTTALTLRGSVYVRRRTD